MQSFEVFVLTRFVKKAKGEKNTYLGGYEFNLNTFYIQHAHDLSN